jgi:hypothetical protein
MRIVAAVAVATVGLVFAVAFGTYAYLVVKSAFGMADLIAGSPLRTSLTWAGDGEWLVAQLRARDGSDLASAWSPDSGTVRTLEGYRVLTTNYHSGTASVFKNVEHTLWAVQSAPLPQKKVLVDEFVTVNKADDFLDRPVSGGISTWDLSTGELSPPVTSGLWATLSGPGGRQVSMDFDVSRGAWPCAIRFTPAGGGATVVAAEPGATGTVIPLGWTNDGSAFAVVRCVADSSTAESVVSSSAPQWIATTVSLLSTADGSVLASTPLEASRYDVVSSRVALDPPRGEVIVLTGRVARDNRLLSLSASEGVRPISLPPRAQPGTATVPAWLLGYDGAGVSYLAVRGANPEPSPKTAETAGIPWSVWSTRGAGSVWSGWIVGRGPVRAFDRRGGLAWIDQVDFPEPSVTLPGIVRDPMTGTEDVMWSPRPGTPAKRVMQGYYSPLF